MLVEHEVVEIKMEDQDDRRGGGGWWSWSETRCSRTAGLTSPSEDPQDRSCNYFQDMNQPSHNACSFYLISLSVLAGMFCLSSSHHLNGGNHAGAAFRSVTAMVLGTSAIFTEVIPKIGVPINLNSRCKHCMLKLFCKLTKMLITSS